MALSFKKLSKCLIPAIDVLISKQSQTKLRSLAKSCTQAEWQTANEPENCFGRTSHISWGPVLL